jgi:hypothetical protein
LEYKIEIYLKEQDWIRYKGLGFFGIGLGLFEGKEFQRK